MATVIRLSRAGRIKKPAYRIVVADSRAKRDGKFLERLGYWIPCEKPEKLFVNLERLNHWVSKGTKLSEKMKGLVKEFQKQAS